MKMVHGSKTLVLKLSLLIIIFISFGIYAKTLKVDTLQSSVTDGDLTLTPDGTGDLIISSGTATTVPYLDANKKVISSSVTPTELGYVSGVTSAIQTQLDALLAGSLTDSYIFVGNVSNLPVGVAVSGDVTISNTGEITIGASKVNSSKILDDEIVDADIKTTAAIDATKIGAGGVTSTEFGYIGTLSSDAQTQINSKEGTLTNSAGLLAALNDETGTGVAVFGTSPTIGTPIINNADVDFGTASNSVRLLIPSDSTINLDALTDVAGSIAYDTTLSKIVINNGAGWSVVGLTLTNSSELAGLLSDETGTGLAVFNDSPTLITPDLGTPSALEGTNITGTATNFTASNVTTNANLTGGVTSVGNVATVITNANLTGDVTSVGNATTVVTNANLTGHITSTGNATVLGSFTSAQLLSAVSDESGGAGLVVSNSQPSFDGGLDVNGAGFIRWRDSDDSNYFGLSAPTIIATNLDMTLPDADAAGALVSDGAGNLSFVAQQSVLSTSADLSSALSDETGTGVSVFNVDPTFDNFYVEDFSGSYAFHITGNTLSTNRELKIPDGGTAADTMATEYATQTLRNKTFVSPALGTPASGVMTNVTGTAAGLTAGNVTTNANLTGDITSVGNVATIPVGIIDNGNINGTAAIDATKIHNGSVDNFEFGYLNGVTTDIQNQIDGKAATTLTTNGDILYYNSGRQRLAKGSDDEVLTLASGIPSWAPAVREKNYASTINWNLEAGAPDITDFFLFDDGPTAYVDGIGGSPSFVSIAGTVGTDMMDGQYLSVTKSEGDADGEGFSFDFSIDEGQQGEEIEVSFNYDVEDWSATSYWHIDIYDVTNANAITMNQPSTGFYLAKGKRQYRHTFTSSATSTSYRLSISTPFNTTSDNGTMKIDHFKIKPIESGTTWSECTGDQVLSPSGYCIDVGMTDPMTTTGDIIYESGGPTRLAIGSNTHVLTSNGSTPYWAAAAGGSGDTCSFNVTTGSSTYNNERGGCVSSSASGGTGISTVTMTGWGGTPNCTCTTTSGLGRHCSFTTAPTSTTLSVQTGYHAPFSYQEVSTNMVAHVVCFY